MEELTMKDLVQCFKDAKYTDALYIGVQIKVSGSPGMETIINPKENFAAKLEYYQKAYNDNLTLKAFDKISIADFCYGESYDDIEYYFEGETEE